MDKTTKNFLIITLICVAVVAIYLLSINMPKQDKIILSPRAVWISENGLLSYDMDETLLKEGFIPIKALSGLDLFVDYDEEDKMLVITDGYRVQRIDTRKNSSKTMEDENGELLIASADLNEEFGIQSDFQINTKTTFIKRKNQEFLVIPLANSSVLKPNIKIDNSDDKNYIDEQNISRNTASIIRKLSRAESVVVLSISDDKAHIMTSKYENGFVDINALPDDIVTRYDEFISEHNDGFFNMQMEAKNRSRKDISGKVFLIWDMPRKRDRLVVDKQDNISVVVSKTGYKLGNSSGKLLGSTSDEYIDHIRSNGYLAWPLVSNAFKPDRTSQFLNSALARKNFIKPNLTMY